MATKINTELIENYRIRNKLTKKEFCKQCGISSAILRKILQNQQNFYMTALFKIARVLKLHVHELFIRA